MKFRNLLIVMLALSLVIAATAAAQDEGMTEMATPTEEQHQLDWFIGEWDVQSRLLIGEDEWFEETVFSTVEPIIGGHALLERFDGTFNGQDFSGVSLRTYNATKEQWEQRWTDSTGGGFAPYTGHFADGEFIGYSDRSFVAESEGGRGEQIGVREVFFDIEEDRFSWRLEQTEDGGETWTTVWTLEYTRHEGM